MLSSLRAHMALDAPLRLGFLSSTRDTSARPQSEASRGGGGGNRLESRQLRRHVSICRSRSAFLGAGRERLVTLRLQPPAASKGVVRTRARAEIPDFLPASWAKPKTRDQVGPNLELTAEAAVLLQLSCLQDNDAPYPDHGVEVMYRFAAFDPFELCRYFGPRMDLGQFANFDPFQRSRYFGPRLDLGQFERFRRLFHHSTYRVLLGHKEREVLSSFALGPGRLRQRVRVLGLRPGEDEVFEFTVVQREGGSWDGYWFTESLIHDGEGLSRGIAY